MARNLVWCLLIVTLVGSAVGYDLEWWESAIFYQIYPNSFKDSDGDGYGDFNGITEKLPYLKEMGVGAICLPSILSAPSADLNSEVKNFTDVDPKLGTLKDFERLINKTKELGIKVILEFDPNHSSDQHGWFQNSVYREDPYTDYYVWADGKGSRKKRAIPVGRITPSRVHATASAKTTVDPDDSVSTVDSMNSSVTAQDTTLNNTTAGNKQPSIQGKTTPASTTIKEQPSSTVTGSTLSKTTPSSTTINKQPPSTPTGSTLSKTTPASTAIKEQPSSSVTESARKKTTPESKTSGNGSETTIKNVSTVPNSNSTSHHLVNNTTVNRLKTIKSARNSTKVIDKRPTSPPNNWVSNSGGSAWQWHEVRKQYYLHQDTAGRPDLNYRNEQLVKEMKNVLTFWLDRGVDGFWLTGVPLLVEDALLRDEPKQGNDSLAQKIPYNLTGYWNLNHLYTIDQPETYDMVAQWRQLLDDYSANQTDSHSRVLIIDGMVTTKDSSLYYGDVSTPGAHLVISCNFICEPKVWVSSYIDLLIRWWEDSLPANKKIAWMTGNQNVARAASRFTPELVDVMNTLVLLLPGIPFTYYGEEIGMQDTIISFQQTQDLKGYLVTPNNYKYFSGDPARTPFQWNGTTSAGFSTNETTWLPVNGNYKGLNLHMQSQVSHSHYSVYRDLAKLRKRPVIQHGEFYPHIFARSVFGFARILLDHPSVVAVINLGSQEEKVNLLQMKGTRKEMCVYTSSINADFPQKPNLVEAESVVLPPLSTVVLSEECLPETDAALISTVPSVLLLLLCTLGAISVIF